MSNHVYEYRGPVMRFDVCLDHDWKAVTSAPSEKKAKNNLSFRYKQEQNMARNAKIDLPGKLTLIG